MNLTWRHVALVSVLLAAVVVSNFRFPGTGAALTGILSTVIAYLTKPQLP